MKKITLYIFLAFASYSCTNDFEEINESQTGISVQNPDFLFTRALVTGSGMSYTVWQYQHQLTSSAWIQHFANIIPRFRYDNYKQESGDPIYNFYYSTENFAPLALNYNILDLIQKTDKSPIKIACTKIWNAYLFHQITDSYGDIPYSEAFKSLTPKFDSQKNIYIDLLKSLDESVQTLKQSKNSGFVGFGNADIIYQGNTDKWIKFANSLLLRLSLRVSNVDENLAKTYLAKINPSELILSNQDNALIKTEKATNAVTANVRNALGYIYGWEEIRISKTLMDYLDGTNYKIIDPRIKQFAETTKKGTTTEYKGLENGQTSSFLGLNYEDIKVNYSNIGPYFNTQAYEIPINIITAAEVNFLIAEAKLKGFISAGNSADFYYQEGIKNSMNQYSKFWNDKSGINQDGIAITDSEITNYINAEQIKYKGTLEQIITQKWISLFANGQEAWSEYRRTGFPKLNPLKEVETGAKNEVPSRLIYSTSESRYNSQNYNDAVQKIGGNDSQNTKVWWDK